MNPILESQERIEAFFNSYSNKESKELLWSWLKTTVTGNYCHLSRVERDNLVSFYEELTELLDSLWEFQQTHSFLPDHPEGGHHA